MEYTYDAWGNPLSVTGAGATTIGQKNPFRYRGYFYDIETGLYYLQSRYYSPKIGRFVCADNQLLVGDDLTGNEFVCLLRKQLRRIEPIKPDKLGIIGRSERRLLLARRLDWLRLREELRLLLLR